MRVTIHLIRNKKSAIAVLVLFAVFALLALPAAAENSQTDRVIFTSGYGESVTTPDKVMISFAVETTDPDAKIAQQQNAERIAAVVAALKSAGIAENDLKTIGYSIYSYTLSQYNPGKWPNGTEVYEVRNTIQMTSYDVSKAGEYIDAAVGAGANSVSSLQFGLSDAKQVAERNKALVAAVIAARADANSVASALGVNIVSTGTVSVDQSRYSISYNSVDTAMVKADSVGGAAVPTTIQSGELRTTATVSVVYTY
ncbi:MAG: SIMPL domain-containing protein [Methanocalculaceae archaeon]|nr:SIMPL domain-containing protein [Methanocalculaceae archaeon]